MVAKKPSKAPILGVHPDDTTPFGRVFAAADRITPAKLPHRGLSLKNGKHTVATSSIRTMLVKHHASPEAITRSKSQLAAMKRLGVSPPKPLSRFPTNPATRKGNLAEVVLAEYITAATDSTLPVYRLRYNPNVDQSMKGDDVLAFDLDSSPIRVIVGEAKFRAVSTNSSVQEIVAGLLRSFKGGLPASLQFVADRLFDGGQSELGERVMACATLFARGQLRLDYVGMLVSDNKAGERVDSVRPGQLRQLAIISLGLNDPDALVDGCYKGLA
jgi:hypothetical protein